MEIQNASTTSSKSNQLRNVENIEKQIDKQFVPNLIGYTSKVYTVSRIYTEPQKKRYKIVYCIIL